MPDKRNVDELSIEELERVLVIKKRQARQDRLQRMQNSGRMVSTPQPTAAPRIVGEDGMYFEDEALPIKRKRAEGGEGGRKFLDRLLLLVEGLAVVGLIAVGVMMASSIFTLQDKTAEAQRAAQDVLSASIPTLAPTPTLNLARVVLPGGHTPPNQEGGGQFNFDEIPANLRSQLRDQIFLPPNVERAPTLPETPLRVVIPDLRTQ